jgi:hypothetical protein
MEQNSLLKIQFTANQELLRSVLLEARKACALAASHGVIQPERIRSIPAMDVARKTTKCHG